ncbi:MAG TPA: hypothetical protein VGI10_21070 [Polyangiaceae bacterium]
MAGSLALNCGGIVRVEQDGSGAGSSAKGSAGAGGSLGTGGIRVGGGGSLAIATGGSAFIVDGGVAGQAAQDAGSFPVGCSPAQWSCAGDQLDCKQNGSYLLPSGCRCSATRPRSSADCSAGETFECLYAESANVDGGTTIVPFECSCVPTPDVLTDLCNAEFISDGAVLCGCAIMCAK